jgi:lipopolysaccharide transport system permease protein
VSPPPHAATPANEHRGGRRPGILHYADPRHLLGRLHAQRELLWSLTGREIQGRYRGSYLGILWTLISPLATLAVYTVVFGVIFRARWGSTGGGLADFAFAVMTGMTAYSVLSEPLTRAPGLIAANSNYVNKVVFPLEILPVTTVGAAVAHSLLGFAVLLLALLVTGSLHWTALYLPLLYLPLIALTLGACWLAAALGVFLRDLENAVVVFVQLLFFLTPIIYPLDAAPAGMRVLLRLNPLTPIVEDFRRVLLLGVSPDWPWFVLNGACCALVAVAGYSCFMVLRHAFADVL